MVGSGPMLDELRNEYKQNENVEFVSFIQPSKLAHFYRSASIFCLPSHFEHWGVVVHEAAYARMALLLSDTCGAATEFLINGYNGYLFQSGNQDDFKNKLQELMKKNEEQLSEMGDNSYMLASRITPATWVANIMSVL